MTRERGLAGAAEVAAVVLGEDIFTWGMRGARHPDGMRRWADAGRRVTRQAALHWITVGAGVVARHNRPAYSRIGSRSQRRRTDAAAQGRSIRLACQRVSARAPRS